MLVVLIPAFDVRLQMSCQEKLKVAAELPNGVRTFRQRLEKINEIKLKK